ncbi:MAG: hypothetical protein QM785_14300 [Pyrinomonadaceae bacterium]
MHSLYIASISAIRELAPGRIEVLAIPLLIYKPSLREAATVAANRAFEQWPAAKGYSLHRANVMPLRLNAWEQIMGAMRDGLEYDNREETETFACADFVDSEPEPKEINWPELIG